MDINFSFPPPEPAFDYKLLFDLAPHVIWPAVILIIIARIGPKRIADALANARKISFAGVEIDLKENIAEVVQAKGIEHSSQLEGQTARRAHRLATVTTGARLLWIDEHPQNNVNEIGLFKRLGMQIDLASTDDEATQRLSQGAYDVVLSNWTRAGDPDAGKNFIPQVRGAMLNPEIVFYVGKPRDLPSTAFGLTTRPDELLNLVFDVLERKRG